MDETVALVKHISEHIVAYFDEDLKILRVAYKGVIHPGITAQYYQWLMTVMKEHPQKAAVARGSIYDFRQVDEIVTSNISSTARKSEQVNQQADLQNHPVAIIAKDTLQAAVLTATMKLSGQQERKRIVKNEQDAVAFIDQFHRQKS